MLDVRKLMLKPDKIRLDYDKSYLLNLLEEPMLCRRNRHDMEFPDTVTMSDNIGLKTNVIIIIKLIRCNDINMQHHFKNIH